MNQSPSKGVVQLGVGDAPVAVVARNDIAEVNPEHRRRTGKLVSDARPCEDASEQISDFSPDTIDRRQCIRLVQYIEGRLGGGEGTEIRGVGPPWTTPPQHR